MNDWEHADIGGDDSRKNKFLRLMGANKVRAFLIVDM